ncbi:MAG TPA: mechanosensitive ion channel [bacterium]|mgnify:CR=1 FL=1|nr:mechanosensitive ion channel [bacterium]HPS29725.1 mechanosensitive ion channel [bacterium]
MKGLLLKMTPVSVSEFFSTRPELFLLFEIISLFLAATALWFIAKKFVQKIVWYYVKKSDNSWDDVLYEKKVFDRLAHIVPAMVFYLSADIFMEASTAVRRIAVGYMIFIVMLVFKSTGNAALEIYETFSISKDKPIKGLVQVLNIFVFFVGTIVILAVLMGKSPALLLSGLGAMTAILLLIFKDSILGFVAGIQIIANNSIKKGDWITMGKFDADGEVIDIALNVVKIQNWDKTIVYIPTAKFLEESFSNWRGMLESGGRRICRSISIDMSSIHYLSDEEVKGLEKIQLISEYLKNRSLEISKWNEEKKADTFMPVNGRKLTNIGTFREYAKQYLLNHTGLRKDMTLLVRQLAPEATGLPLQIYVFTNTTEWTNYESIQSDIFDHLFASIEFFGLRIFQNPSGNDFQSLSQKRNI